MRQAREATANMRPEDIAASTSAAASQMSAQQKYALDGAAQLKAEGNALHGAKQWAAAAEKYERAVSNLEGQASAAAASLRTSCQSNLASCFLQQQRWQECADMAGRVLAAEASNRKALYRRGALAGRAWGVSVCPAGCVGAARALSASSPSRTLTRPSALPSSSS